MRLRTITAMLVGLTAFALVTPPLTSAANYATAVINYQPGTDAAPGYDQPGSILGEPSRFTPGEFGGPVDPFSAPWQPEQLLSLGAGGSVTIQFDQPVFDHPDNPFGLD